MAKHKNIKGYTMIEILVAIAVFVIIVIAGVAGFTHSNKMSELKNATDKLAEDIRDIQVKAQANVKVIDNDDVGGQYSTYDYEEGYKLKFTVGISVIEYDELMSKNENLSQENNLVIYYQLPDISLNIKHKVTKLEVNDVQHTIYNLVYLFPDAQSLLIEYEENTLQELIQQNNRDSIKIYIKHDNLDDWRGLVTVNRLSGRIDTNIIVYP